MDFSIFTDKQTIIQLTKILKRDPRLKVSFSDESEDGIHWRTKLWTGGLDPLHQVFSKDPEENLKEIIRFLVLEIEKDLQYADSEKRQLAEFREQHLYEETITFDAFMVSAIIAILFNCASDSHGNTRDRLSEQEIQMLIQPLINGQEPVLVIGNIRGRTLNIILKFGWQKQSQVAHLSNMLAYDEANQRADIDHPTFPLCRTLIELYLRGYTPYSTRSLNKENLFRVDEPTKTTT